MSQTVWPLNENGEIVFSAGTGSGNVTGYLNQDVLPSANGGGIPFVLEGSSVPIESFGAIGDYDPLTKQGTDCTEAFNKAAQSGKTVQLKPGAKYMITGDVIVQSGTTFIGDENYSPEVYPNKPTSGLKMFRTPTSLSTPQLKNVVMTGFTVSRIGNGAEHGVLLDNIDGLKLDLKVVSDGLAHGGAVGIAAFQPFHRLVKNFNVRVQVVNSGDFGLELGNAVNGEVDLIAEDCYREVLGLEPTCTRSISILDTAVAGDTITLNGHGLDTGQPLIYDKRANTAALPRTAYWFVIKLDNNSFKLAETRSDAYRGVATTPTSWVGTHIFYVCNIIDNVNIRSCVIKDRNSLRPPSYANTTGYLICTGNSGGWIGNVSIPVVQIEGQRLLTDVTTSGIRLEGTRGVNIGYASVIGCDDSIQFRNGTLNGIRAENDSNLLDPAYPVVVVSDSNVIGDVRLHGFKTSGIRNMNGRNYVLGGVITSRQASAVGVLWKDTINDLPEFSNLNVNVVGGVSWDEIPIGIGNKEVSTSFVVSRADKFNYVSSVRKSVTSGQKLGLIKFSPTDVYMGSVEIVVRSSNASSANCARYVLEIVRAFTGSTPTVTLLRSSGLTTGGSANHPSFTFSITSGELIPTAVASTSTTAVFEFFIQSSGDIFIY